MGLGFPPCLLGLFCPPTWKFRVIWGEGGGLRVLRLVRGSLHKCVAPPMRKRLPNLEAVRLNIKIRRQRFRSLEANTHLYCLTGHWYCVAACICGLLLPTERCRGILAGLTRMLDLRSLPTNHMPRKATHHLLRMAIRLAHRLP